MIERTGDFVERDNGQFTWRIFDSLRETLETLLPGRLSNHRPAQNPFETVPAGPVPGGQAITVTFAPAVTPAPSATFVPTADPGASFADLVDPLRTPDLGVSRPGPAELPEGGDNRFFSVQTGTTAPMVTIPEVPVGGIERSPNWESDKNGTYGGWAETFRALNPVQLPLDATYGAAELDRMTDEADRWAQLDVPPDTLALSGDFSAGFTLTAPPFDLQRVELTDGSDYVLVANDNFVEADESVLVDARNLGADSSVMFDGSAETDGSYAFFGGQSDDFFFGGGGDDRLFGLGGGDTLAGGGGSDIFVYTDPTDSTGADYDTIADFDPSADRIDLPGSVAGFGDAIEGGSLSTDSFNADLAAALADLGAGQAVWFAPDSGDLAGQIFLIVDGNEKAGYQEGEDYVFAIGGSTLADLSAHTDIFI